jgi:hypothetical protein
VTLPPPRSAGAEFVDVPSAFGITVRDAERLLRKAKLCALFVPIGDFGPDVSALALFEVSKASVKDNLKHMPAASPLPCELDFNDHRGPKLIFGGAAANEHARRAAR